MNAESTLTPRADDAAALFERRIKEGAYGLRGIPGERRIASELGVSYMLARKVVQRLIDKNVIHRGDNGRLKPVVRSSGKGTLGNKIGFLGPAYASTYTYEWQYKLSSILRQMNKELHPIYYTRASDPVIFDALKADFDGLFIIAPIGAPKLVLERIAKESRRVVILFPDLSHMGLFSTNTSGDRFVGKLVDHLLSLGHKKISCFNVQPENQTVQSRIQYWRSAIEQRGIPGDLHHHPVQSFASPILGAYQEFGRLINEGLKSTAYFCVTSEQARGVVRACHERGIRVGKDISLCSVGENETAQMMVPSLTILPSADSEYFLRQGLEWIRTGGENWNRPLLLEPDNVEVLQGESTGPCIS